MAMISMETRAVEYISKSKFINFIYVSIVTVFAFARQNSRAGLLSFEGTTFHSPCARSALGGMAMSSLAGMQLGAGRFRVSRVFFRAGRVASWDSEGVLVEWSVRGSCAGGCGCRNKELEARLWVADSFVRGSEDGVDGAKCALKALEHYLEEMARNRDQWAVNRP